MGKFQAGDVVQIRESLMDERYKGKVVTLSGKPDTSGTWKVQWIGTPSEPFACHESNFREIPVPKVRDRVKVRSRLGANGLREGTVISIAPSGALVVDLDGSNDDCYFLHWQLEIIDPAPTEERATKTNALRNELKAFTLQMTNMSTDARDWGFNALSDQLDDHARILVRLQNKLYWAMLEDGILNEEG